MIMSQFLHTKLPHYLFQHLKNPQVKWKNSSNLLNGVLALCLWKAKQRSFLLLHYPPPDATRSLSYSTRSLSYSTRSLSYSTVLLHCPTPLSYSTILLQMPPDHCIRHKLQKTFRFGLTLKCFDGHFHFLARLLFT